MAMLNITGEVYNVYIKDSVKRGEETIEEKPQVQLLGEIHLPNGGTRFDLVTLSTDAPDDFKNLKGQRVTVPIGAFSPSKGSVIFFIPKGSKPCLA